jgi:DNA-binding response OmpR family regulator
LKPFILILLSDKELSNNLSAICNGMDWFVNTMHVKEWQAVAETLPTPQVVLISMQYPENDGLSVCWHLRQVYNPAQTKVITLSNALDLYVEVSALNTGVDEFMRLPMPNQLFKAKLLAWRRSLSFTKSLSNKLSIDKERHLVIKDSESYSFSKKEFEVISVLASRPMVVFSRSEIKKAIWNESKHVSDRLIDVYVSCIRRSLGASTIQTVKGVGYSLQIR